MTKLTIEQRITKLEQEIARLEAFIKVSDQPWWERVSGVFANDPGFDEAMRLGRKYRESLRPKPKPRSKSKLKSKSSARVETDTKRA